MGYIQKMIGKNLKYLRYQRGLAQDKFYEELGLDSKYLSSIERGEVNVTIEYLYKLSQILNVDIREFFDPSEDRIIKTKRIDSRSKKN